MENIWGILFKGYFFLPIAKARKGCSLILHIENVKLSLEVKPIERPPPLRPQPPWVSHFTLVHTQPLAICEKCHLYVHTNLWQRILPVTLSLTRFCFPEDLSSLMSSIHVVYFKLVQLFFPLVSRMGIMTSKLLTWRS